MHIYRRIRSLARTGILAIILAFALTCGGDPSSQNPPPVFIKVDVSQLPSDTKSLSVNVALDGVPQRHSPYALAPPATEFWIELDAGSTGHLSVTIDAIQAQGCFGSSGRIDQQIAGEPFIPVKIVLVPMAPAQCPITVIVHGDGKASLQTPPTDCRDQCTLNWPLQQQITLKANPDRPTAQYVWSGGCTGTSDCQFLVTGAATVVVDFTPKVCTQDAQKQFKWCWENPLIQGNTLSGAWVAPDKTVYAVGNSGTIIAWTGTTWTIMDAGTYNNLGAVWGSSTNDIWAVGDSGIIIHYKNGTWSVVNSGVTQNLYSLAGTGPNDIWSVGAAGVALHWNGSQWSVADSGTTERLNGVWQASVGDAWAVGDNGAVVHWNGAAWSKISSTTAKDLSGVWGSGSSDIWIAGDETMLHWTGSSFVSGGDFTGRSLYAIWGTGTNNIYAASGFGSIYHWDGIQWTGLSSSANGTIRSIAGTAPSNVWAVGTDGSTVYYDGTSWKSTNQGIAGDFTNLRAGWASSSLDAWVTGVQSFGVPSEFTMHWLNGVWTYVDLPDKSVPLYAIWGSAVDNVWAAGDKGTLMHWNGALWTKSTSVASLRLLGMYGSGPNDIWAVGNASSGVPALTPGIAIRWNGSSWQTVNGAPADFFNAVYAIGSDVWIAGNNGRVWHWDGTVWVQQNLGTTEAIQSIGGTDKTNLYASSSSGVFHYDGSQWSGEGIPGINSITKILAVRPNEAWITTDKGVLRNDGTSWTRLDTGTSNGLNGIFGLDTDLWVYGRIGTILHYRR